MFQKAQLYEHLRIWCTKVGRALSCGGYKGPPVRHADLTRLLESLPCDVQFGAAGPDYDPANKVVRMPEPASCSTLNSLYTIAHEYGHYIQHTTHGFKTRRPGLRYALHITPGILWEEAEATLIGWGLLLREDLFHPKMLWYGFRSWATYALGMLAQWAWKQRDKAIDPNSETLTFCQEED